MRLSSCPMIRGGSSGHARHGFGRALRGVSPSFRAIGPTVKPCSRHSKPRLRCGTDTGRHGIPAVGVRTSRRRRGRCPVGVCQDSHVETLPPEVPASPVALEQVRRARDPRSFVSDRLARFVSADGSEPNLQLTAAFGTRAECGYLSRLSPKALFFCADYGGECSALSPRAGNGSWREPATGVF